MQKFNTIKTKAHYEMRQFPTPILTISLRSILILFSYFLHNLGPIHVAFMANKMVMGQDFSLKNLLCPCSYHSTDVPYS